MSVFGESAKTSCFFLEDFTEELLSLHDAEIQRLKQHYEDHKELFDGVQQWEESWRLFLELEVSLTGDGNQHPSSSSN